MALDSQQKRMSAAGVGRPSMRAVFPVATPTEAWRVSIGLNFSGNAIGALSISADAGVYTIAGTAAVFDRVLPVAVGSYTIAGTDVTLTVQRVIVADAGAYAVSGTDVTFDRLMSAAVGVYTIVGTDATLLATQVLDAAAGIYTIAGTAVTFDRSMAAAVGAYTLAGTNVTFDRALAVTAGTYAISGTPATFDRSFITAAGAYTVNGTDATLVVTPGGGGESTILIAEVGVYSIIGTDTTLSTITKLPDPSEVPCSFTDPPVIAGSTGLPQILRPVGDCTTVDVGAPDVDFGNAPWWSKLNDESDVTLISVSLAIPTPVVGRLCVTLPTIDLPDPAAVASAYILRIRIRAVSSAEVITPSFFIIEGSQASVVQTLVSFADAPIGLTTAFQDFIILGASLPGDWSTADLTNIAYDHTQNADVYPATIEIARVELEIPAPVSSIICVPDFSVPVCEEVFV